MSARELARNVYIRSKYFGFRNNDIVKPCFVFYIDDGYHKKHTGLVDRLKAIVGTYYIAKSNGLPYKLSHHSAFDMDHYLVPNLVNWEVDKNEISHSLFQTKLFTYKPHESIPILKPNTQYHCFFYTGHNIIREQEGGEWEKKWKELFFELFKPSEHLNDLISSTRIDEPYIAIHLRFVNALDHFESENEVSLTENEKEMLVERCIDKLYHIQKKEKGRKLIVFSDSVRFLRTASQNGFYTLNPKDVGHVSFASDEKVYDKAFVDFFSMMNAERVYSIRGRNLYNSVFSQYASILGNGDYVIEQI